MILKQPFIISSRLLPALNIGDSTLSWDSKDLLFYVDAPSKTYVIDGFRPGLSCGVQDCFDDILSFMLAAAEAQDATDAGRFTDNGDLFEPELMVWCQENRQELEDLQMDLEQEEFIS